MPCARAVQVHSIGLRTHWSTSSRARACGRSGRSTISMRAAMAKLFRDEPDVRQVIKLKAIYELLETVTDRCEDVANIIEGIVLENS